MNFINKALFAAFVVTSGSAFGMAFYRPANRVAMPVAARVILQRQVMRPIYQVRPVRVVRPVVRPVYAIQPVRAVGRVVSRRVCRAASSSRASTCGTPCSSRCETSSCG